MSQWRGLNAHHPVASPTEGTAHKEENTTWTCRVANSGESLWPTDTLCFSEYIISHFYLFVNGFFEKNKFNILFTFYLFFVHIWIIYNLLMNLIESSYLRPYVNKNFTFNNLFTFGKYKVYNLFIKFARKIHKVHILFKFRLMRPRAAGPIMNKSILFCE